MSIPQPDRRKNLIKGAILSLLLITSPFLFYVYKFAPADQTNWDTFLGTLESGSFSNVQSLLHALFTKITFVLLTGIWFLISKNWWRFAILVPFTMFLFQLSGVISYKIKYMDEYDFWDSLPFILPIVFLVIYISYRLSVRSPKSSLDDEANEEVRNMFSDKL